MKTQNILLTTSVLAQVDLRRFRFAGLSGGVCAAGAKALGPVEANTGAGSYAPVNLIGVLLVEAGGAVAAGVEVESNALGQAVTKAAGIGNGWTMDSAVQAGDVIRIVRGI